MFRVRESETSGKYAAAAWVVQVTLVLALLASLAAAGLALRQGTTLPVTVNLVGSLLLAIDVAGLWWLRRRDLGEQRSLRRLKMLAHDILASMDRGVVTTDRQGIVTSINSAGIALLGVDFECVGRPLAAIAPVGVPLESVCREVVGKQAAVRDRDCSADRAGRILRLRLDGHVLRDMEGHSLGCVLHLRDVTSRVLLEERMRRMERFLGLATLASGLHHEIKNPLTALSIHIQLLEEALANGQTGEAVDELVGVLRTEVCRLNGVLESFRSFANLQNLTVRPTDALGVVENAIRLIRPQAAGQHVQITLLHPEKELPPVPLDAEKFEQAILNLIINALEAMPEGGRLTISASTDDGVLRVSVRDNGPGIPAEIRPNLFQPYFSTKSTGSGMGLPLSEKLISQHGGHIDYRTGPDGTVFDVTIPLEQPNGNA